MKVKLYLIFLLFSFSFFSFSQVKDSIYFEKNGISKPSILSVHPYGVFFNRLQGNFKAHATKKTTVSISLESGNVWSPDILSYIPNDEALRNQLRALPWYQRHRLIDEATVDAKTFETFNDGVIKGFRANVDINLAKEHQLTIGLRTFLLTTGKLPFSFLTGDEFIEYFHSNIAGGEDPFDRRIFGLNNAEIKYVDRNGNALRLDKNDLFATGIEASYYYYPEKLINAKRNLFFNFGAHLGGNLAKENSSLDFGLTTNVVKVYAVNDRSNFHIGMGIGVLRKNLIDFKNDNVLFATNDFIGHLETAIEYNFTSKRGTTHSFSANFYLQTSLNKKNEYEYVASIRNPDAFKAWGHGVSNLYENNNYWTLMYSFTKKITTSFYLQQDFTLNNLPDIQTGVAVSFGI